MRSHWAAGNAKLRGKKYKLLQCQCCTVQDFREKETHKWFTEQIKDYTANLPLNKSKE